MEIITYIATDPDNTPENARATARIRCEVPGPGGKWVIGWAPVYFLAATPEEARARAQSFWDEQLEKERAKKPRGRPPKAKPSDNDPVVAPAEIGDVL